MSDNNPLLVPFNTPFDVPPFAAIEDNHYMPAIHEALNIAREEIRVIRENENAPTFENTIEALEDAGLLLGKITPILFNLNSAETNETLQQITQEATPLFLV